MLKFLLDVAYAICIVPLAIWKNEKCKRNPKCRRYMYPKD